MPVPTSPAEAYFAQVVQSMLEKDLARRPHEISGPLGHFTMLARALEPPSPVPTRLDANTLLLGTIRLSFVVGDIAAAQSEAIVSSANFELKMRTGVGGALRKRGGDVIEEAAMAHGEQALGSCIATTPGMLTTKRIFHAVSAWNEVSCVGRAFARALLMAEEHGCHSLAAPALGTGVARVGLEACATAMMTTLRWHTMLGGSRLREITIWLDSDEKRRAYRDAAEEVLGVFEAREMMGQADLGLPVSDAAPSPEGVTFIDAEQVSGKKIASPNATKKYSA